jgi:hypothetical protein
MAHEDDIPRFNRPARKLMSRARAFQAFYELGENRSLGALYPLLREAHGAAAPSLAKLAEWAAEDEWVERTRGWDVEKVETAHAIATKAAAEAEAAQIDQLSLVAKDLVTLAQTILTGGNAEGREVDGALSVEERDALRRKYQREGRLVIPGLKLTGSVAEVEKVLKIAQDLGDRLGTFSRATEVAKPDADPLAHLPPDAVAARLARVAQRLRPPPPAQAPTPPPPPGAGKTGQGPHRGPPPSPRLSRPLKFPLHRVRR